MSIARYCLFLVCLVFSCCLRAQNTAGTQDQTTGTLASQTFKKTLGASSVLYTGSEYIRRGTKTIGHPYYSTDQLQPFNIWYKGTGFETVPALFDLEKDQLIIEDYRKSLLIALVKAGIDSFQQGEHFFVKLKNEPETPFMERLENGPLPLFCRRQKYLAPPAKAEENSLPFFVDLNNYYVLYRETLYTINDEKDLIKLLPDMRSKIKSVARSSDLRFKKDKENALRKLIANLYQTSTN